MTKEEQEFKKECDEKLYSIYSKIDEEEKIFLSYLVNQFNNICERNFKAIDKLICCGEMLDVRFQQDMLEILEGGKNE